MFHNFLKLQVYLRKAEVDPRGYIAWLCGGALVGPRVVLTSAACVEDVAYLYVVAGYDKYVSEKTKEDKCIKNTIRKVVQICVPKGKNFILVRTYMLSEQSAFTGYFGNYRTYRL